MTRSRGGAAPKMRPPLLVTPPRIADEWSRRAFGQAQTVQHLSGVQPIDFDLVDINANDMISHFSHAGTCHQTDIA